MTLQQDILAIIPNAYDLPHTERTMHRLRDAIYHNTAYVNIDQGYGPADNWTLHAEMFHRAVNTDEGFACGGRALLFLTLLQELGIEARYVGMFEQVIDHDLAPRSHASVDLKIDGRWQAFDPHYNVSFIDPATRGSLGWQDIHARVQSSLPVQVTTEGYNQDHFLNTDHMTTYYAVDQVCQYMVLGPSFNETPALLGNWDGKLRYTSGAEFDTLAMVNAPHYALLAVPPSS